MLVKAKKGNFMKPLENIKILDLSTFLPGPYCTMLLSDLGAEIIKVESLSGDGARSSEGIFLSVNRGKKSLSLDLKSVRGLQIFKELASNSDVIIESFRPGVCQRLGIDYSVIKEINEQIIYCSISAYGQTGPYKSWPAFDLNILAISGVSSLSGDREGPPADESGIAIADYGCGMSAALAILSAIIARFNNNRGQYIDVAMIDAPLSWIGARMVECFYLGMQTKKELRARGAYGIFETKDGACISLVARFDKFWKRLCQVLNMSYLIDIPNYATISQRDLKQDEINELLRPVLLTKTSQEWVKIFTDNDIPCTPVNFLDHVAEDPQVIHRKSIFEISTNGNKKIPQVVFPAKFSDFVSTANLPPPKLGEHTYEILTNLGYRPTTIENLARDGILNIIDAKNVKL